MTLSMRSKPAAAGSLGFQGCRFCVVVFGLVFGVFLEAFNTAQAKKTRLQGFV